MAREIKAYRCRKCGTLHYPFRMVCRKCRGNDFFEFDTEDLPSAGTLLTFTFVHALPADFEVAKLGLAMVELENGMRIVGQLRADDPQLGMKVRGRVEPVRQDGYTTHYGMVFYAA